MFLYAKPKGIDGFVAAAESAGVSDRQEGCLAHQSFDLGFLGVAVAAVGTEGFLGDLGAVLGGEELGRTGDDIGVFTGVLGAGALSTRPISTASLMCAKPRPGTPPRIFSRPGGPRDGDRPFERSLPSRALHLPRRPAAKRLVTIERLSASDW